VGVSRRAYKISRHDVRAILTARGRPQTRRRALGRTVDRRRRSLSRLRTTVATVGGRRGGARLSDGPSRVVGGRRGDAHRPDRLRRTGAGARAIRRYGSRQRGPPVRAVNESRVATRRTTALVPGGSFYDCDRVVSQPTRPPRPAVRSRLVRPVRRRPSPDADACHVFAFPSTSEWVYHSFSLLSHIVRRNCTIWLKKKKTMLIFTFSSILRNI